MALKDWLRRHHVVICVGSGGVGKTTTAATLGLAAAKQGRRAVVITIDPARRLAESLGLSHLSNKPEPIALGEDVSGELWAMMLDPRATWNDLVARLAGGDAQRDRILNNRVYRYIQGTFAGSQEYMATERLYDLATDPRFDLVILDTPPVKNALDFLDSPGRMVHFLDEKILKWFLAPYESSGSRWFGASAVIWRLLSHVFGRDFLDELAALFQDFKGMYTGITERHAAVVALFAAPETSFVTVCAPTRSSIEVASFFQDELGRRGLGSGGVIVNRVVRCERDEHDAGSVLREALREHVGPDTLEPLLARLGMAHRRLRARAVAEQSLIAGLTERMAADAFLVQVPQQRGEVHSLPALDALGRVLLGAE